MLGYDIIKLDGEKKGKKILISPEKLLETPQSNPPFRYLSILDGINIKLFKH